MAKHIAALRAALSYNGEGSSDFDLNANHVRSSTQNLRPAAVLVPLFLKQDRLHLILTKRASALQHHPGQIAFPGGKVDAQDKNVQAAALREAHEEIGLPPQNVEVLGHLPCHETVTRFSVTPVVGLIKQGFSITPNKGEVDEVFDLPLHYVTKLSNYQTHSRFWQGQMRCYPTVPYGPYYIWGATARMLQILAKRLA